MACKLHLNKSVFFFLKDLYKNVHSSFIHNSPKLETIQMVFQGEWINCGIIKEWNLSY